MNTLNLIFLINTSALPILYITNGYFCIVQIVQGKNLRKPLINAKWSFALEFVAYFCCCFKDSHCNKIKSTVNGWRYKVLETKLVNNVT